VRWRPVLLLFRPISNSDEPFQLILAIYVGFEFKSTAGDVSDGSVIYEERVQRWTWRGVHNLAYDTLPLPWRDAKLGTRCEAHGLPSG
jgi:hypothetical protein